MFGPGTSTIKNTSYKVVLPFYLYAALSLLVASIFLLIDSSNFTGHYFHPHILLITHAMALGWGTMIILGASHQLVPVLIESKLYSNTLAYLSFFFAAAGIPILLYGFYIFDMGWPAQLGGSLVILSILAFIINMAKSMADSKQESVHAIYVFTASIWLVLTTILGLAQVLNFTKMILPSGSLHYLTLHAHAGIVGWFLLLMIGVASRLIPMFLISKYSNVPLLWSIYALINGGLLSFVIFFLFLPSNSFYLLIPVMFILFAIVLFIYYCYKAYALRLRKQVDNQVRLSLLSILMLLLPVVILMCLLIFLLKYPVQNIHITLAYGFVIFFGWLTAIILGMTFKTLPFIVWNKIYHHLSGIRKTPNPKDLFSSVIFKIMCFAYILGFILFASGIILAKLILLNMGSVFLLITALLYNWNVLKIIFHQQVIE